MKLVKIGADWCGPCKVMDQTFESMQKENALQIEVDKINLDKDADLDKMKNYGIDATSIRGVPTLLILNRDNVEVARKVGALNATQIEYWLKETIG